MTRPIGERPVKRWEGLLAGRHLYRATTEDPGQLVMVSFVEGMAEAEVLDGEDAGEVFQVRDAPGTFEGPLPG